MGKVSIDLTGRDNVSPALQSATARLGYLRTAIDEIKARGKVEVLTVADTSNLTRMTSQANRLERALQGVGTSGVQSANSLKSSFGGLQSVLGGLGLGGFGAMLGGVGLAAAAAGAGRLAVELGRLGEVNREVAFRFEAFTGSGENATRMIQAMSRAAEGGVDDEELMRSATLLLSTELMTTAEELASVTRSALMLGNPLNSATANVEAFTNAMMTGSARALRQFGITTAEVDSRVKLLAESSAGLSDAQIRANAIMQIAAEKAQKIADAGGHATTRTQQMRASVDELKDALAEATAQPYMVVVEFVTKGLNVLTAALEEPAVKNYSIAISPTADSMTRLEAAKQSLKDFKRLEQEFASAPGFKMATPGGRYAIAELELLIPALERYGSAAEDVVAKQLAVDAAAGDLAARQEQLAQAMAYGTDESRLQIGVLAEAAEISLTMAQHALLVAQGLGASGVAARNAAEQYENLRQRSIDATAALDGLATASNVDISNSAWYGGGSMQFYKAGTDAHIAEDKRYADTLAAQRASDKQRSTTAATQAAQAARSAWEAEMRQASSTIQGYLKEGMNVAKGLEPGGEKGGIFAPGANGPFEPIYQAMAVAKGGIEGPQEEEWARMYNLTPETAAKIASDFQRGLFSPDVIRLIGPGGEQMLADYFSGEKAADASMAAFASRIEQKAGLKPGTLTGGLTATAAAPAAALAQAATTPLPVSIVSPSPLPVSILSPSPLPVVLVSPLTTPGAPVPPVVVVGTAPGPASPSAAVPVAPGTDAASMINLLNATMDKFSTWRQLTEPVYSTKAPPATAPPVMASPREAIPQIMPAPMTNNISLTIAAGAVQVVAANATQVGNEVVAAIFKALMAAESAIGLPPRQTAPGMR